MAIIHCNILKKNYLLFFFIFMLLISEIIPYLIDSIYPLQSDILDSLSQFLIYIPYFIWKNKKYNTNVIYKNNPAIKEKKFSLKNKENIIFILIIICHFLYDIIYTFTDDVFDNVNGLFNRYNIQILLYSFLSKYTLNTRYYIHNLISQIIFEFFAIFADYFYIKKTDNFKIDFPHILLIILVMIFESVLLIYKK